jgi:hypothetical protein
VDIAAKVSAIPVSSDAFGKSHGVFDKPDPVFPLREVMAQL